MFYQIYEWQRQMFSPVEDAAKQYAYWLRHPLNPFATLPASQAAASIWDRYADTSPQYHSPDFEFDDVRINGKSVDVDNTVVHQTPFCLFRRFRYVNEHRQPISLPEGIFSKSHTLSVTKSKEDQSKAPAKILLISPISGNYAVVFNDAVQCFLPHGEVWVTDWVDARDVPLLAGSFALDENVKHLMTFIENEKPDHLVSFSQSTNPALIALTLLTQKKSSFIPQSLTIIGGPMDTRINESALGTVASELSRDWIEENLMMEVPSGFLGQGRKVFPGFLQHAGFMGLHWDRQIKCHWEHLMSATLGNDARREHMDRTARLLNAVMDIPAEHYLENLYHFFLHHSLPKGELICLGKKIDPSIIRDTSIFVVEGDRDTLCPTGQTQAVFNMLPTLPASKRRYRLIKDCGHFGLVGGHNFKKNIYPCLLDWMKSLT